VTFCGAILCHFPSIYEDRATLWYTFHVVKF